MRWCTHVAAHGQEWRLHASCSLPGYNEARGVLRPDKEEKEPPLLVALQEGAADPVATEDGRTA